MHIRGVINFIPVSKNNMIKRIAWKIYEYIQIVFCRMYKMCLGFLNKFLNTVTHLFLVTFGNN